MDGLRGDVVTAYDGAKDAGRQIEDNLHIVDHTNNYVVIPANKYVIEPVAVGTNKYVIEPALPVLHHLQEDGHIVLHHLREKVIHLKDLGAQRLPGLGCGLWGSSGDHSEATPPSGTSSRTTSNGWVKLDSK